MSSTNDPRLDEKSAPIKDWAAGRSRRGGCLMLGSVFLILSSCVISINGSTRGSSFWTLANFFRSSCEKLAHNTRSYLPSPTLICTPTSLAEPANSSPVRVSPLVSLNVSAQAASASNPQTTNTAIKQNLRTMKVFNNRRPLPKEAKLRGEEPLDHGLPTLDGPHDFKQILHHPVGAHGLQPICRRAVLPNGIANRLERISPQRGLGQQTGEIPGQHVAAAALGQVRIARRIHINLTRASANERLMALEHHPGIAESPRNVAQRT